MAAGTSVGDLYLRLGLNLSELETGFVTASQTVAANISRLNRESNLIRIRSEIDIAGLDETADATRILQIRTNALNQQMQIQRDRIRILDAEYQNLVQTQGANSAAAQRATVRLERERLALANLDRELQNLNDSANSSNNGMFDSLEGMLPKLQGAEIVLETISKTVETIKESVTEVVENFRELQKQSYELDMPFEETRDFLREMKLAGGDIGDIEGFIRGISDAYVKGEWDDPEFIALRKYGAEITDATGRLKSFKDMTDEVYRAWEKAEAAGEGIEFLQLLGGEMGVRDIIQYFQRLKEAREDAAKIYEANIDYKQLHELDRVLGRVEEQSIELKNAIGDIFTPAAQAAGEKFFQMLHDGTAILVENKNEIQTLGRVAVGVFEELAPKINSIFPSGNLSTGIESFGAVLDKLKEYSKPIEPNDEMKKYLDAQSVSNPISALLNAFSESNVVKHATENQREFNGEVQETTKSWADFRKEVEKADKTLNDKNPLNQYAQKRIQEFRDELEDLQIELNFHDNDYQKEIEKLKLFNKRESVYKNFVSEEEAKSLDELTAARKALIDLERDENLSDIRKSVDEEFKSSIDARIDKINEEKEAWISAGMDAAEAMELSQRRIGKAMQDAAKEFEDEVDRIKGEVQSLEDKVFEQEHSQYQNDLRKLQQERIRLYEAGSNSPEMIERYYQNALRDLNKRASKDKDYRKSPDGGAMQRGGNGIQVISGDKIIDDGLIQAQQKEIGLLADENQIRAQLLQKERQELSSDAWAMLAKQVQQTPQPQIAPPQQQQSSGFQIIEGDKIVSMPTEPLQEFGYNLQQLNSAMAQMPLETPADLQSPLATTLPTESFQALQMSTTELATAQDILAEKFRSLSEMQMANPAISQGGFMLETPLNNIDVPLSSILQEMQAKQTTTLSVETIVLPLNNIASIATNILSALSDRKPANINVAPSIRVELSGAYVFDNAMKKSLTDDITKEIVSEITSAVRSATSQSSYGYGA